MNQKINDQLFDQLLCDRNLKYSKLEVLDRPEIYSHKQKLTVCCDRNHNTIKSVRSIIDGATCVLCIKEDKSSPIKLHERFLTRLSEYNQERLSPLVLRSDQRYKRNKHKLVFVCDSGHELLIAPEHLLYNKNYECAECRGYIKKHDHEWFVTKITELNVQRPERRLHLIPDQIYKSLNDSIDIRCDSGHVWSTNPKRIFAGFYCPYCNGNNKKTHEQFCEELKTKTDGFVTVRSDQAYVNMYTKLIFNCALGHEFEAKPGNIFHCGLRCSVCSTTNNYSRMAIDWLNYEQTKITYNIRHALNGGEYRIPKTVMWVDGFCDETKTIYEFHGDYWHGNPLVHPPDGFNKQANKTFKQLYEKTLKKEDKIRSLGYNLVTLWESDWNKLKENIL